MATLVNFVGPGLCFIIPRTNERAIQLSLDAVVRCRRTDFSLLFLGRRWYRTTAAAAAAMTNESRQAGPVPIWNERDVRESERERNTFASHVQTPNQFQTIFLFASHFGNIFFWLHPSDETMTQFG